MDTMTAEQALEAAKGLTFEAVWAALMEDRRQMEESRKRMDEIHEQTQKEIRESQQKTDKILADLSKNIGGLGNSIGRLTEALFSAELWRKFNELGYPFTKQGPHVKFYGEDKKVLAEADFLLENGDYVMAVEVKAEPAAEDVSDHLQRIEAIRRYYDAHGDKRKLVGAVAGGAVNDNVLKYAQKHGLYVIVQTGDSVAIAESPPGFKAREW